MSRYHPPRVCRFATMAVFPLWAAVPPGVHAQEAPPRTAETVIERARIAYGPPPPEPVCGEAEDGEILVCAEEQEQSQFRVAASSALDPESDEALDDGLPRAPSVAGAGIFHGEPTFSMGAPPPPALIVDVTALPLAPAGSDADRIARGLAPKGDE